MASRGECSRLFHFSLTNLIWPIIDTIPRAYTIPFGTSPENIDGTNAWDTLLLSGSVSVALVITAKKKSRCIKLNDICDSCLAKTRNFEILKFDKINFVDFVDVLRMILRQTVQLYNAKFVRQSVTEVQ